MTDLIDILLVDDEPRNLDALEAILDDRGYRLLRADSADAALRLLLDHEVAAIVLDIKMPGMSGFELAQIIKSTKKFRQVPIIFLTAYMIGDQDVIAGYGAGAVDYLTKPINPQILRHKVAVFADLFRKTRALAELNLRLEERVAERTAALDAAAKQKDEFLAILAHELRNPLAPLRTGLDLVMGAQQKGQPASDRTIAAMNRQLDHMVRLIDDLLDISRISRGVLELKKDRVDLAGVIDGAIDTVRPLLERRKLAISADVPRPMYAHADPTRVTQILGNLLNNAAKFTPEGGRISIELARDGEHATIVVRDSGMGIPASQLDRVFEMFARVDRGERRTMDQGLGIGLALSRRLADLHSGTLTATSEGEGKGSTFTLRLPALAVVEVTVGHANGKTVAAAEARGFNILVIEDNDDIADTLAELLGDLGHQVAVARTGPEGVEMVQKVQPEIVLCDLGLPGMDGVEVCRSVRALQLAAQPIMIALTGWGREDDRRRTSEAGFDHHLVKPIAADKLHGVLRALRA